MLVTCRHNFLIWFGFFLLLFSSFSSWAMKPVNIVSDSNNGMGVMRGHGDDCYVMAPMSLSENEQIKVRVGSSGDRTAALVSQYDELVGLYRLEDSKGLLCMSLWPNPERVPLLLKSGRSAYLHSDETEKASSDEKLSLEAFGDSILAIGKDGALNNERLGFLISVKFSPVAMVVGVDETFGAAYIRTLDDLGRWSDSYFEKLNRKLQEDDTPSTIAYSQVPEARKVAQKIKLREQPDATARPLKILREGWEVDVMGKVDNSPWLAVRYFGLEGFLPEKALQ